MSSKTATEAKNPPASAPPPAAAAPLSDDRGVGAKLKKVGDKIVSVGKKVGHVLSRKDSPCDRLRDLHKLPITS